MVQEEIRFDIFYPIWFHFSENKKKIAKKWKTWLFPKYKEKVWVYDPGQATTEIWKKFAQGV